MIGQCPHKQPKNTKHVKDGQEKLSKRGENLALAKNCTVPMTTHIAMEFLLSSNSNKLNFL